MKCEKVFVQLLFAVSFIAVGIHANSTPCPKSPGFRPSDEAREKCEEKIVESLDECREYVDSLLDIEDLTAQQRFDLAEWLPMLSWSETSGGQEEFLRLRSLQEYRRLHEEFPDDVQVMSHLAPLEDEETGLGLQRRTAELAPDCNSNNYQLSIRLDRLTDRGKNRAEQDEDLVQVFADVLVQGYEHAENSWFKMYFGQLRYREYLLAGDQDHAKLFWNYVVAELDPGNFPFQLNTLTNGWDLLCGDRGYQFRFAGICLDAIEKALKEALDSEIRYVDHALVGASLLAKQLVAPEYVSPSVLSSAPPNVHEVSFRPYTAREGARILIRLRDLLESVPQESRFGSFNKTYRYVLGQ